MILGVMCCASLLLCASSPGHSKSNVGPPAQGDSRQEPEVADARWENVRGPNFDGRVDVRGIVETWSSEGPPVLWSKKLGQGYSSFVGQGGRVFTQYQSVVNQFVVCLDGDTGAEIWRHRYGWSYETAGLYPGPRSTPTLQDGLLYFTGPNGTLGCLRQSDGTVVWQRNPVKEFEAKPVGFGYACSPLVIHDKVIVPVGGKDAALVAFDKQDGSVLWQSSNFEISYASLLPIEHRGRQMLVAYLKNAVAVFETATGELLTQMPVSHGYDEHSAWPIYQEPYLWLASPFREGSQLLEIKGTDSIELERVWGSSVLSNDVCSSVLVDGFLYGFDIYDVQSKIHRPSRGQFRCIEFSTGRPQWSNGSPRARRSFETTEDSEMAGTVGHSSVLYADGKLILLNDTGDLILLRCTPEEFSMLARVRVFGGDVCWTQPMLLGKKLYVRNQSQAVCLYLGDPDELKASDAKTESVAAVRQGSSFDLARLVFSVEPEFAMDAPTNTWLIQWFGLMLAIGWGVVFPVAVMLFKHAPSRRAFYRVTTMVLAVLGTTWLSHWMDDFVFTWPLALYVVFEALVYEVEVARRDEPGSDSVAESVMDSRNRMGARSFWLGRLIALAFIAVCLLYFYICRRLSLAFEWSFLLGFPAAIPFLFWAKSSGQKNVESSAGRGRFVREWLATGLAFTTFYWLGAAVILWKY